MCAWGAQLFVDLFTFFYFLFFFVLFFPLWSGNVSLKHRTRKSGLAILNNSFSEFSKMEVFFS